MERWCREIREEFTGKKMRVLVSEKDEGTEKEGTYTE
jgi:hypothetical protein